MLKVLNGVYLTVCKGEKVGIIGESGCGKTTTLKAILRILSNNALIEKGGIYFKGSDILKAGKKELTELRRKHITMIFQDPTAALNPVFQVGTQLMDVIKYSKMQGNEKNLKAQLRAKSLELLSEVALSDPERVIASYPFQLSGGMKQRICIATSLATANDLLFADEPTTNLDVTIQDQVLRLMKDLVEKRQLSLVLVSHALGAVRNTVDRTYVMYAGNMVEASATRELFSNPLHPYTQGLLDSVPKLSGGGFSEGIRGRVPDYLNPSKGCRFHPRCDYASEICANERPAFTEIQSDHTVACWHYYRK
jgi:peptide/nickel transport system ATP-binding protein